MQRGGNVGPLGVSTFVASLTSDISKSINSTNRLPSSGQSSVWGGEQEGGMWRSRKWLDMRDRGICFCRVSMQCFEQAAKMKLTAHVE